MLSVSLRWLVHTDAMTAPIASPTNRPAAYSSSAMPVCWSTGIRSGPDGLVAEHGGDGADRRPARRPGRAATHQVVVSATPISATTASVDQQAVEVAGAVVAERHGQGALAGDACRSGCRAGCWRPGSRRPGRRPRCRRTARGARRSRSGRTSCRSPRPGRRRRTPSPRRGPCSRRAASRRCRTRPRGCRAAPTPTSHQAVVAASTRPTSRGAAEGEERGRLDRAGVAALLPTSRSGPTRASSVPRTPSE